MVTSLGCFCICKAGRYRELETGLLRCHDIIFCAIPSTAKNPVWMLHYACAAFSTTTYFGITLAEFLL